MEPAAVATARMTMPKYKKSWRMCPEIHLTHTRTGRLTPVIYTREHRRRLTTGFAGNGTSSTTKAPRPIQMLHRRSSSLGGEIWPVTWAGGAR